jgi:replicative DNA helicase
MSPHNLDAERCVLGSCILSTKASSKAIALLKADDFFLPAHGLIFESIKATLSQGREVDFVTVRNGLGSKLVDAGGIDYLMQVAEYVPSAANIGTYCEIVKDKATRRTIIQSAKGIVSQAVDDDVPTSELVLNYSKAVSHL